jgi:hypothetical protein
MKKIQNCIVFIALFCGFLLLIPFTYAGGSKPIVREESKVVVDGVEELWRLEWVTLPQPVCRPEDEDWSYCLCSGFAFGEYGDLQLVRQKPGQEEERFPLTPLFEFADGQPAPQAVLRRWDEHKDDHKEKNPSALAARVKARPLAKIMKFADYDHDGSSTEFMLQIGTEPCGKRMSIIVGVSRKNPRLHAFTSVTHPEEPLLLQDWHWEALRQAKGSVEVVHWPCSDHGYDGIDEYKLRADNGNIFALKRQYECNEKTGQKGRLLEDKEF